MSSNRAYESKAGQLQHGHRDGPASPQDYGTQKLSWRAGLLRSPEQVLQPVRIKECQVMSSDTAIMYELALGPLASELSPHIPNHYARYHSRFAWRGDVAPYWQLIGYLWYGSVWRSRRFMDALACTRRSNVSNIDETSGFCVGDGLLTSLWYKVSFTFW